MGKGLKLNANGWVPTRPPPIFAILGEEFDLTVSIRYWNKSSFFFLPHFGIKMGEAQEGVKLNANGWTPTRPPPIFAILGEEFDLKVSIRYWNKSSFFFLPHFGIKMGEAQEGVLFSSFSHFI